jgi:RES domain-containing protein
MRKHPDGISLARRVARCIRHVGPRSGEVFRATSVEYANRDDLLTGQGAKRTGGRWNPPGSFATVYLSLTPETALAEYLAHHRYFGFKDSDAMPYVTVGIEATLGRVLDLTDGAVRRALRVSDARMTDPGWRKAKSLESLTQALGRLCFEAEFDAVVVPSSASPGSANLVVFPGNLTPPDSYLRIVNRDKLPPPSR